MASMIILVFLATLATIINYHIVYSVGHDNINVYLGSQPHSYCDLNPYLYIESPIAEATHYNFSLLETESAALDKNPLTEVTLTANNLWLAVRKYSRPLLENYFTQEATFNVRYTDNFTVLHKLVQVLTDKNERIKTNSKQVRKNRKKLYASLAYIIAHKKGKLLLEAGNQEGQTPLHLATINNYFKVAEILLKAGACVHSKDSSAHTALDYATLKHNIRIAKLLVSYGARVTVSLLEN